MRAFGSSSANVESEIGTRLQKAHGWDQRRRRNREGVAEKEIHILVQHDNSTDAYFEQLGDTARLYISSAKASWDQSES